MKIAVRKERKAKADDKQADKGPATSDTAKPKPAKSKAPRRDDGPKKAGQDDRPKMPPQADAPKKPARDVKVREEKPPVSHDGNDDGGDDGWNGPMPSFLDAKINR